jgi:hypothetical protein
MSREFRGKAGSGVRGISAAAGREPGKRARTDGLRAPVQRSATVTVPRVDDPAVVAAGALADPAQALPHGDAIQRAFGSHDIGGIEARVGGAAADASAALGAEAYAFGDLVAFADAPDLRLAAHEAAHVVQQRGGVQLSGGLDAWGDPYERHADAVAERVVQGESAADLLDQVAGGAPVAAVQRSPREGGAPSRREREEARTRELEQEVRAYLRQRLLVRGITQDEDDLVVLVAAPGEQRPRRVGDRIHVPTRREVTVEEVLAVVDRDGGLGQRVAERRGGLPSDELEGINPRRVSEPVFWVDSAQIGEGYHLAAALAVQPDMRYVVLDDGTDPARVERMTELLGADRLDRERPGGGIVTYTDEDSRNEARRPFIPLVQATAIVGAAVTPGSPHYDPDARARIQSALIGSDQPGAEARELRVRGFLATQPPGLLDPGVAKVLVWVRGRAEHEPERSSSPTLLHQMAAEIRAAGMTPVFVGHRVAELPEGIDLTEHWEQPPFKEQDGIRAQLVLFDLLHREHGVHGQVGMRSGGMDGPALIGLPTVPIGTSGETRMRTWDGMDGYERVAEDEYDARDPASDRLRPQAVRQLRQNLDGWHDEAERQGNHPERERLMREGDYAGAVARIREDERRPGESEADHLLRMGRYDQSVAAIRREADADAAAPASPIDEPQHPPRPLVVDHPGDPRTVPFPFGATPDPRHVDDDVELPTRPRQPPPPRDREVAVTSEGLQVTAPRGDGGTRQTTASVGQHGASFESTVTDAQGTATTVSAGFELQTNASGEVIGGDASFALGGIGGTVGYTYEAQPVVEHPDDSCTVAWRVELRGELPLGVVDAGGERSRAGTQAFGRHDRARNRADAEAYRHDFRSHARREVDRLLGGELGTVTWWRAQEVGTERSVASGGHLSASGAATLAGLLSLGGQASFSVEASAHVRVTAPAVVRVTQRLHGEGALGGTAGYGVSVGLSGTRSRTVEETFEVVLETGDHAFGRFLARACPLEVGQRGVTLRERTVSDDHGHEASASVVVAGGLRGGSSVGETTQTQYDENGNPTGVTRTATGNNAFTGGLVDGTYAHREMSVAAPETAEGYDIVTAVVASAGDESASLLAGTLGEEAAGDRARSSGSWQVAEGLSQDEALEFHRRLLQRARSGGAPEGPLQAVWERLRHVPTNDHALATRAEAGDRAAQRALTQQRHARAAAITALLAEHGRLGVQLLRDMAGATDDTQYLRLFHGGEEDMVDVGGRRVVTFLGRSGCQQLEQWIEARLAGAVGADEVAMARRRIAEMEARIAQIANIEHYTDLPPDMRAAEVSRYRRYVESLGDVARRGGDGDAAGLSPEGQAQHEALRALQHRVDELHRRAAAVRTEVLVERERVGQVAGEHTAEGHLPDEALARTDAMWSSAELSFQSGDSARGDSETRLGSLGIGEQDRLAAYRSATIALERALPAYQEAHREMRRLLAVYRSYVRSARGGDEALHRRRPARARAAQAETAGAAPAPQQAPAATSSESRLTVSLDHDALARCFRQGVGTLDDLARSPLQSHGPVPQPGGLVVNIESAFLLPHHTASERNTRGYSIYGAELSIVHPYAGTDEHGNRYEEFHLLGVAEPIANRVGTRFVHAIFVAPPG